MYYEIHGSGDPVVLLHGAFMAISDKLKATKAPFFGNRVVSSPLVV